MLEYNKLPSLRRMFAFSCLIIGAVFLLIYSDFISSNNYYGTEMAEIVDPTHNKTGFLVSSSRCEIPDFNPFSSEAIKFFHKLSYIPCRKKELLTYVRKTDNIPYLHIDTDVLPSYTKEKVHCCYSYVERHGTKNNPDDGIKFTECKRFEDNVTLTDDYVMVTCKIAKSQKEIYKNTHAAITVKEKFREMKSMTDQHRRVSVLFIGIDSISRLNLIRSMPLTYHFLNDNEEWIPLKGYNKIADNTFPNLMGIFTGFNESRAYKICDPKSLGKLDNCPIIWREFEKLGYITGYAEDEATINTFNFRKKGFTHPPTDYYFRPYVIAAQKLKLVKKDTLTYCAGPETSGERIMNLAVDFATTFNDYPNFGFFWMNTFSHNDISAPSRMDSRVSDTLKKIKNNDVLNNSIVIVLSDHGIRFGEIRYTFSGWLEERLPFIYVSFPPWFKEKFPQELANFRANTGRLTTPYDLHMTLQDILALSGSNRTIVQSDACPKCKSLFSEIEMNRSCEDAAIAQHWCTCGGYSHTNETLNETVFSGAKYVITQIQHIIDKRNSTRECAKYALGRVLTSYISDEFNYKNDSYLLLVIEMKPKAVFEATISIKNDTTFSLEGGISRLDQYGYHSKCVHDAYLKEFCFCRK